METKPLYISDAQSNDIMKKLEAHLDDLLTDIKMQVVDHLSAIIESYRNHEYDETEILHPVQSSSPERLDI